MTCKTMRKTPDRPKVALPKASQPNEILLNDFKEMRDESLYVLFITEEYTRYTRGQIMESKQPKEVIKPSKPIGSYEAHGGPAKDSIVTGEQSSAMI